MVAERAAGRGVGSALLAAVENWARDRGFPFLILNVFAANESAHGSTARRVSSPTTFATAKPCVEARGFSRAQGVREPATLLSMSVATYTRRRAVPGSKRAVFLLRCDLLSRRQVHRDYSSE